MKKNEKMDKRREKKSELENQYKRIHIWIRGDPERGKRQHERKEVTQK